MNLSRHEQGYLMRLFRKIQRYFSHHWVWLNIYDKFIDTEQTSENIYHTHLWHTKYSNLAEVRWQLSHMMYTMYTKLLHCIEKPVGEVLLYMYMYNVRRMGGEPPLVKKLLISPTPPPPPLTWKPPPPPPPNFYSLIPSPPKVNSSH